jgi:hypothetical protein
MISYGNIGDVLGYRPENLGDRQGALDAFQRAAALADAAVRDDPSDRRAQFDLVNIRLRLGSVLAERPDTLERGIAETRVAARTIADLLAADPASDRYGQIDATVRGTLADALLRAEQPAEAGAVAEAVVASASRLLKGPSAANVRASLARARVTQALAYARTGDRRALAVADQAAADLSAKPLTSARTMAIAHQDLGLAYLELAVRGQAAVAAPAVTHLESSHQLWRDVRLPAGLEPQRAAALATIADAKAKAVALATP